MAAGKEKEGSPLILKVLSGVHLGAEIELGMETLSVGRDPGGDIVLEDRLLADKHLELRRAGEQVEARILAEPSALDGQPLAPGTHTIPLYKVLTAGSTHLAFGARDAAWPVLHFPEETLVESAKARPALAAAAAVAPVKHRPGWGLAVICGLVAVALLLAVGYGFMTAGVEPEHSVTEEEADLKAALSQFKDRGELSYHVNQHVFQISGRVPDDQTLKELRNTLNSLGLRLRFSVQSWEALVNSCRSVIQLYNANLTVEPIGMERIRMRGYSPTLAGLNSVVANIQTLLPRSDALQVEVGVGDTTAQEIRDLLREYSLSPYLKVSVQADKVSLAGLLPREAADKWNRLQATLRDRRPQTPLDITGVQIGDESRLENQILGGQIVALHTGDIGWVRLSNDNILHAGSALADGWVLSDIAPNSIRVRQGDVQLQFNLSTP
jgi:type III secretion system YscD/HrpQ family protein